MYKNKYVQNKIIKNNLISYKIEYLTNLNNFKLNNNLRNCSRAAHGYRLVLE